MTNYGTEWAKREPISYVFSKRRKTHAPCRLTADPPYELNGGLIKSMLSVRASEQINVLATIYRVHWGYYMYKEVG